MSAHIERVEFPLSSTPDGVLIQMAIARFRDTIDRRSKLQGFYHCISVQYYW